MTRPERHGIYGLIGYLAREEDERGSPTKTDDLSHRKARETIDYKMVYEI